MTSSPQSLADSFLKSLDGRANWKGCGELFGSFVGHPKPVIYAALCEALRRRGNDYWVQFYAGFVLLKLVPDASVQVDELIDIVAPVFDVSNGEIPAFLVEQVGIEAVRRKVEERKKTVKDKDLSFRLGCLAFKARAYHQRKEWKAGRHGG